MARNEYPCEIATDVEIMIYDSQHDRRGKGITAPKQEAEERRLKKRFVVSTLAQYRWQDSRGTWFSDSGMTLNISVAGVFVLTTSSPPTGAAIEVKVAVPGPGFVTGRGCLFG